MTLKEEYQAKCLPEKDFKNKVLEVAKALDLDKVEIRPFEYENRATISNIKTGVILILTNGGYKNEKRINISGDYPKNNKGERHYSGHMANAITVTQEKDGESIAKAIKSRFYPSYLSTLEKTLAYNKEANISLNIRQGIGHKLSSLLNENYEPQKDQSKFYVYNKVQRINTVEISYRGKIKMELEDLNTEEVEKVINLLKTFPINEEV